MKGFCGDSYDIGVGVGMITIGFITLLIMFLNDPIRDLVCYGYFISLIIMGTVYVVRGNKSLKKKS